MSRQAESIINTTTPENKIKHTANILLALALSACGGGTTHHEKQEAVAIYWHEGNRYSAAIRNGDVITMERLPSESYAWQVEIMEDAKNLPWYECAWKHSEWSGVHKGAWCNIHVKSIDQLGTGNWNHGKFGSGATTRID